MKQSYAVWLLAGMAVLGGAAHAADMPEHELGLLLGGGRADKDLVGGKDGVRPLFGLRYGQQLNDDFNLFGDLVYGAYDGNRAGVGDADVLTLRGGLEWLFSRQQRYHWFLSGGLGLMSVNTGGNVDFTRPMASLGIGQEWAVGTNDAFRWELRADQSFGNGSLPNAGLTNVQALLGYSWGLGAPPDSDGDGVANRQDVCPHTPRGAQVDVHGCPLDADNDGVFDGLDRCPDTPAGVKVDAGGCPLDSDGDGIPDHRDACPAVPAPGTADGCLPAAVKPPPPPPPPAPVAEPQPAPAVVPAAPRRLMLDGVNFDNDSASLRPESLAILDNAAATLKEWGEVKVEVAGYTDAASSIAYNLTLSQRRAETVRAYLITRGIAAERLTARGYGEAQPVAGNKTAAGRAKNRRVELVPLQ